MSSSKLAPLALGLLIIAGCAAGPPPSLAVGDRLERRGDEIVIAGQFFHTGTPVVLWLDPGGYDAYRAHCWSDPEQILPRSPAAGCDTPHRHSLGRPGLDTSADTAAVRAAVRQFVLHYDVAGSARRCFYILHDVRGLSVHFLLDVDGTIYQTLDLKERARHAGPSNDVSVGVEIAHPGYLTPSSASQYSSDSLGVRYLPPPTLGSTGVRRQDFVARPRRPEPITGSIHGQPLEQYDFTAEQYQALAHLALCLERTLGIPARAPRDAAAQVETGLLDETRLAGYAGLLGHWHVSRSKVDPGPAFDWDHLQRLVSALGGADEGASINPAKVP